MFHFLHWDIIFGFSFQKIGGLNLAIISSRGAVPFNSTILDIFILFGLLYSNIKYFFQVQVLYLKVAGLL